MSINIDKNDKVHLRLRYADKDGKIIQKHVCKPEWTRKKDAKAFQDEFLKSLKEDKKVFTVNSLYEIYIAKRKMKLKSSYNYDSVHRLYIRDSIGMKNALTLNQDEIREWQHEIELKHKSQRYTDKIQDLLRTVLRYGVNEKLIENNPFTIHNIEYPDTKKEPVHHWTPRVFTQFINVVDDPDYNDFINLVYANGLRYGEAVALRPNDYNWEIGGLRIDETWDAKHKIGTSPKMKNSYRVTICTQNIRTMIERRIRYLRTLFGYSDDCFLFGFHTPLSPTTMQRKFDQYIEKAGVERITIHALRHSHVFYLREMGWSSFDIAKRLGHTVEMVDEVYGQWNTDRQSEMIKKIDEDLAVKPVEKKKNLVLIKHFVVKKTGIYQEIATQMGHSKNMN